MRLRVPLALVAITVVAVACGRSRFEPPDVSFATSPPPTGTPTPLPDFGDGSDGPLVVTTAGLHVNACFPVFSTTAGAFVPGNTFVTGDRVVLWQVQAPTGTAGALSITSLDSAGVWTIVTVVTASSSGILSVTPQPAFNFHSGKDAGAQACRLPQYESVVVNSAASITAVPWDGQTGGVVGFFSSGPVEILAGGVIDASAAGFRGASLSPPGALGFRGDGLDARAYNVSTTINLASSGGGGGQVNCGGAGGGSAGAGGHGGDGLAGSSSGCGGTPGAPVLVSAASRWAMGAGGGSGEGGGGTNGVGGAGGGVVFLRVAALTGAGRIAADGVTGGFGNGDGAGGAGAGGLLYVSASSTSAALGSFSARGGRGADATAGHGPGGGGGGGRIYRDSPPIPGTASVLAGLSGSAGGVSFGALPGADGVIEVPLGN